MENGRIRDPWSIRARAARRDTAGKKVDPVRAHSRSRGYRSGLHSLASENPHEFTDHQYCSDRRNYRIDEIDGTVSDDSSGINAGIWVSVANHIPTNGSGKRQNRANNPQRETEALCSAISLVGKNYHNDADGRGDNDLCEIERFLVGFLTKFMMIWMRASFVFNEQIEHFPLLVRRNLGSARGAHRSGVSAAASCYRLARILQTKADHAPPALRRSEHRFFPKC